MLDSKHISPDPSSVNHMDEQKWRLEEKFRILRERTTGGFQSIDQMFDEDAAMIRETEDYYLAAMLNTSPCDRERAEHAVDKLHRTSGLVPSQYIWFDSPYKASIAVLLLACYSSLSKPVTHGPFSSSKRQYREASKRALERGREALEPKNTPLYPGGRLRARTNDRDIQQDEFGTLYRKVIMDDEPIVVVEVENSTPEPDGTFKRYFLRVDPQVRTAREAVAWTFNLAEDDYKPAIQT